MSSESEIEQEILNQVAHLRWAAAQGFTVPTNDIEEIPEKRSVRFGKLKLDDDLPNAVERNPDAYKMERDPLVYSHHFIYHE